MSNRCGCAMALAQALLATTLWGSEAPLTLRARSRAETAPGSGRFYAVTKTIEWEPRKTAIVICDMWDRHWCKGATARVAEMAPRMNSVLSAARDRGVLIIHCPSDTMKSYQGHPGREWVKTVASATPKSRVPGWAPLDRTREPPLPIDDRDGGCDCAVKCRQGSPWRREIEMLSIEPGDAIDDGAGTLALMQSRGIEQVILMGVHTNMCVLGRPFAIRRMVSAGQRVLLMRDMTDTMYCSQSAPRVSHFTGTDLVVEHIEKHWCPTILSSDFVSGGEFRFKDDHRPRVALVMAEEEYKTPETLPVFARNHLDREFRVESVWGDPKERNRLLGWEVIRGSDVMLVSVHRRALPTDSMAAIREHVKSSKPVVGIRTASHAFAPKKNVDRSKLESWPEFDREVLGGNYHGHHGNKKSEIRTLVWVAESRRSDPLAQMFPTGEVAFDSWLYKTSPLASGCEVLLMGRAPDRVPPEPVAWTYKRKDGGRSFYVSLGHPSDFKSPVFQDVLTNGVRWAAGLPIPEKSSKREPAAVGGAR